MYVLLTRSISQNENLSFKRLVNEKCIKESSDIYYLCYHSISCGNFDAFETCLKIIEPLGEHIISEVRKSLDILISKAPTEKIIEFLPFILKYHRKEVVLDILRQKGSHYILKAILQLDGYSVNQNIEGNSALHLAQSNNEPRDLPLFENLLKLGENPNQKNDYGETPLACQILRCKDGGEILAMLRLFYTYGAKFTDGEHLLRNMCQSKVAGRGAAIQFLLENCKEINRFKEEFINAAVTRYSPGPDMDEVIEALLKNGFSLNKVNNEQLIFYLACRHGCMEILNRWEGVPHSV